MTQRILLLTISLLTTGFAAMAQNVGINEDNPTNALHIRTVVPNADPLRVEGLRDAQAGDTEILVCQPASGVVRLASIGDLFTDTDDQTLSFNPTTRVLSISEGNSVDLSAIDTDTDEQTLNYNATTGDLSISNGNAVNIGGLNTDDQTLTLSGQTLSIEAGNAVTLPDSDNQTLGYNSSTQMLSITNGNQVSLTDLAGDHLGNHTATQNLSMSIWDADFTTGELNFGTATRQMINLWGVQYGLGIQSSTLYQRSGGNFAWYLSGAHSDGLLNPGTGGTLQMVLTSAGRLGIGTDAPAQTLDVNGNLALSGENALQGGSEWLRINQNGDFASGVYTPGLFRADGGLTVNDNGTAVDLRVEGDTEPNLLRTNGATDRVGIGTANPGALLDVNGKAQVTNFQMTAGAANDRILRSDAAGNASWVSVGSVFTDTDTDTDDQTLVYNAATNTLTITEGNSVNLDDLDTNDNLGNHSATQELDMNNNDIRENRYVRFNPGNGNGVQFWNSAIYSISMGSTSEYTYGPITGHSIKSTMSNTAGRGWTWGPSGAAPIAALTVSGDLQLAGYARLLGYLQVGSDATAGRVNIDGTNGTPALHLAGEDNIWFDAGQVRITTHDGYGNFSLKSGADNNDVKIGNGGGAVKMRLEESGTWMLQTASGLTNGDNISWNTGLVQSNNGRVGIGTPAPGTELHVVGNIFATGNASDRRFKRNIRPYAGRMLDLVDRLQTVQYEYRTDAFPEEAFPTTTQTGFVAQDLEQLVPNAVFDRADGYKGVDYGKVTPVLVAAVQELRAEVEALKAERDALRTEVQTYQAMEARLERLEALLVPPSQNKPSTDATPVNTEKE